MALNQKNGINTGRVLWYDPNPNDNVPINVEDLNISVSLEATSKNKSVIINSNNGTVVNNSNNNNNNKTIKFIRSTVEAFNSNAPITTSYSEIEHILNNSADFSGRYYESIGIESINIEFNTSYAPMIKIKMIDVRGSSIFSSNGKGDYNFFFELPYPLFNLEIKGFYGRPVNYCLHLIRFNASFNSQTGNFEIDCDFIGYTYALLNDMLMSLLRGVQDTTLGNKIFNEIKAEYKPELQPEIIKINELINKVNEGKYILNTTIGRNPAKEQEITELDNIRINLQLLIKNINKLIEDIYFEVDGYYSSPINSFVIFKYLNTTPSFLEDNITDFNNKQQFFLSEIEKLPKYNTLSSQLTNENVIQKYSSLDANTSCLITLEDIKDTRPIEVNSTATSADINSFYKILTDTTCYGYPKEQTTHIDSLLDICKNLNDNNKIGNDDDISIIDFTDTISLINNEITKIDAKIKKLEDEIVAEVNASLVSKTTRPTSTIRNLFRVLTTGVDNFLKTLHTVSVDASTSADRAIEMGKITGAKNKDSINYDDLDLTVSPWPEYREKDESYYKETYLGTVLDSAKVPELKFTEELVATMIKQKKEESVNVSLSAVNSELPNSWYPLTVLDNGSFSTNGKKMRGNPYLIHSNEGFDKPNDMVKVLILRMFLLMGFCNRNRIESWLIQFHAQLEAHNLYYILRKLKSGKDKLIVDTINGLDFNGLISTFGPTGKKMFKNNIITNGTTSSNYYTYTYIRDTEEVLQKAGSRAYLPVNNNFDKTQWYSDGKLKDSGTLNDFISKKNIITAINVNNYIKYNNNFSTIEVNGLSEESNCDFFNIVSQFQFESSNFSPPTVLTESQSLISSYGGNDQKPYTNVSGIYDIVKLSAYYKNPLSFFQNKSTFGYINTYRYASQNETSREVFFTPSEYFGSDYIGISNFIVKNKKLEERIIGTNKKIYEIEENIVGSDISLQIMSTSNERFNVLFKKAFKGTETKKLYGELVIDANKVGDYNIPFIGFGHLQKIGNDEEIIRYSLFGSRLYYSQTNNKSKAFLFLHTFPFQGLSTKINSLIDTMLDYNNDTELIYESIGSENYFNTSVNIETTNTNIELKDLFRLHNGMIRAPKIWVLFIGAIFWARKQYEPIINPKDKKGDGMYVIPNNYLSYFVSDKNNNNMNTGFLGMLLNDNELTNYRYKYIDSTLLGLPESVKIKFINEFESWADSEFISFREELEIKDENGKIMNTPTESLKVLEEIFKFINDEKQYSNNYNYFYIQVDKLEKHKYIKYIYNNYYHFSSNIESYSTTSSTSGTKNYTVNPDDTQVNFLLRPKSDVNKKVLTLMTDIIYIQNSNPHIWNPNNLKYYTNTTSDNLDKYHDINVHEEDFKTFYDAFREKFKKLTNGYTQNSNAEDVSIKKSLFGTENDETIRLNIYRTLMSIYEKWISGVDNDRFFAQCSYNIAHDEIAKEERTNILTPRLIDSFRFVDRAFRDVSNKLYVNPKTFTEIIKNNSNATFFDVANKVLNDNNFVFVPLPTFFNFNKVSELKESFEPFSNNNHDDVVTGPSFVCVYVGQVSNHLDLKYDNSDGNYIDDGIFISNDGKNIIGLPSDFTDGTPNPYEMNIPIFSVNYGQQNQNFFKDIKLDQKEFTETAESLEIINDLSNQGDTTKETYVGQNLFNVYQKRSYSCEVEMLGNALIQPMMYFQLNNIPMFRGMYLIINVKHSIKPNQMTTTFKGVRVKKYKTPLLQTNEVFSSVNAGPSSKKSSSSPSSISYTPSSAKPCETFKNFLNDDGFLTYLSHQQGAYGGATHIKVITGKITKYPNYDDFQSYVVGNYHRKSCTHGIDRTFIVNKGRRFIEDYPIAYATAFLENMWIYFNDARINGMKIIVEKPTVKKGNNILTNGEIYETIKGGLIYFPGTNIKVDDLIAKAYIENSLLEYTKQSAPYQTMFQLDKGNPPFVTILNYCRTNIVGNDVYYDLSKLCEKYYPRLNDNFKDLKNRIGSVTTSDIKSPESGFNPNSY